MYLELSEGETRILRAALHAYLTDLREEIVKTDKHEWRVALHHEEDVLREVLARLQSQATHVSER